jgi:hypothetical protein
MSSPALNFIDTLPWEEVSHAYGSASDGPVELRRLLSSDEGERQDAINGFLYSSVYHQYSVFTATPFVVASVIKILEEGVVNDLPAGTGETMASELLHFVRLCAEEGHARIEGRPHPLTPTIEEMAMGAASLYQAFSNDANPKVRARATELIAWIAQKRNSRTMRHS